jgi:hypothetical protein
MGQEVVLKKAFRVRRIAFQFVNKQGIVRPQTGNPFFLLIGNPFRSGSSPITKGIPAIRKVSGTIYPDGNSGNEEKGGNFLCRPMSTCARKAMSFFQYSWI